MESKMQEKADLKSMYPEELAEFLKKFGEPSYKAKQIFAWLHRSIESFDEMTDISKSLREKLMENSYISKIQIKKRLVSDIDSTVKYLYGLMDGESIESVLMSYNYGDSLCISTQAGCRMGCSFCASTIKGLNRGLTASEMLDQVLFSAKDSGKKISHVVLMGIGEPLDNYDNVVRFLRLLSNPGGINMSLRHVSLSTCGIVEKIEELSKLKLGLTLSVSLHAPNDEIRSALMPINQKWGVDALLKACREYLFATGRRISFEYAMINGVNDSVQNARELGEKLRGMHCHVNLIPVNEVTENVFKKSTEDNIARFAKVLTGFGLNVTVRRTLGADINASCGQLRHTQSHGGVDN